MSAGVSLSTEGCGGVAPSRTVYLICGLLLAASILFQKIALPGSGGVLGFGLFVLLGLSAFGLLAGQLVVSRPGLAALTLFVFLAAVSAAGSNSVALSKMSLALLIVCQFPLVLRFRPGAVDYTRLLDLINLAMVAIAVLGIAQFIAQFLIGPALPFSLDLLLPESLSLEGFNQLIPLSYGASVYKSNGVFLAEPSFFSQFLAVGVIIEVVRRCRPSRLGLYMVALLCSYSGSGLIMLAVFVPFYLVQRRQFTLLAMGGLCIVVIVLAADSLQLDALVSRAREFSNPGSSGYARFISPFVYIRDHLFADPVTLLLGRGPGTVTEHFESYYYTPFDPTWAKLIYEFGVLGCAAYLVFFAIATRAEGRALAGPITFTYFILGGYLQDPFILSLLVLALCWSAEQTGARAGGRLSAPAGPVGFRRSRDAPSRRKPA